MKIALFRRFGKSSILMAALSGGLALAEAEFPGGLWKEIVYARSRGMNSFAILNLVPKPKDKGQLWTCWVPPEATSGDAFYRELRERLDPYVAELRRHGLEKLGYLYGFDERKREHYASIDELWQKLRRDYPEPPVRGWPN